MTIQIARPQASPSRGFLVSGAAVAGGFSLGFPHPLGDGVAMPPKSRNQRLGGDPSGRQGVIRIARSEWPGHAHRPRQLVARSWAATGTGHLGISNARQNSSRTRMEELSTGGSRGIRESNPVRPRRRRHGARDC